MSLANFNSLDLFRLEICVTWKFQQKKTQPQAKFYQLRFVSLGSCVAWKFVSLENLELEFCGTFNLRAKSRKSFRIFLIEKNKISGEETS